MTKSIYRRKSLFRLLFQRVRVYDGGTKVHSTSREMRAHVFNYKHE